MKILLVEDDFALAMGTEFALQAEGYEVLKAKNVAEARMVMEASLPDLLLLDVMLPDGDGMDFCSILRTKTQAPVIFLTARDESESVIKGFRSGGDDYITKPYDLNVLKARIEAQLRRNSSKSQQHPRIELPNLTVDLFAGTAILDGNEYSLTVSYNEKKGVNIR